MDLNVGRILERVLEDLPNVKWTKTPAPQESDAELFIGNSPSWRVVVAKNGDNLDGAATSLAEPLVIRLTREVAQEALESARRACGALPA